MNTARGKEFKHVLDVGNICLIQTDATIRAATNKAERKDSCKNSVLKRPVVNQVCLVALPSPSA